jgi:hypothetical protein
MMLFLTRWFRGSVRTPKAGRPARRSISRSWPTVEVLEDRRLLATFVVTNLLDAGPGSLRQALLNANSTPGPDRIDFAVAGTIQLTSGPLPAITDPVNLNGPTGIAGTPVVEIDYNGFGGLQFNAGSGSTTPQMSSTLRSLGHVNAAGAGVTLNAPGILVVGNCIGLRLDGTTPAGNGGNGLEIHSFFNSIGGVAALDRNVISGNAGNGIAILAALSNQVRGNFVGTDVTGTLVRGNGGNGILLATGATANIIGGAAPAVPYSGAVPPAPGTKPPEGNLISGNGGNGVLLTDGASSNVLAGNFIGTNFTGLFSLGKALDGVAILNGSNNNSVLGTYVTLNPFIFYNVISGNEGNGLRVRDSNNTVIQANFFGLGSDNNTPVGNALDGVLIEGTSVNTLFGGIIPLGNVTSGNGQNGVEIRDTAQLTVVFNAFAGVAAFNDAAVVGNGLDGVLITSTGAGTVLRTSQISGNAHDGVEISGDASGVTVTNSVIGLNIAGNPQPNGANGIEIGGNASGNLIGGFEVSIAPRNVISANVGHGVTIVGNAHGNHVFNSFLGTDISGTAITATVGGITVPVGNGGAGIFLGGASHDNTIGGIDPAFRNLISGNLGDGIELSGATTGNQVIGNLIGTDRDGLVPLGNLGSGVAIEGSSGNFIGGTVGGAGNTIAFNGQDGVVVDQGVGNAILGNAIFQNAGLGIRLVNGGNHDQPPPC